MKSSTAAQKRPHGRAPPACRPAGHHRRGTASWLSCGKARSIYSLCTLISRRSCTQFSPREHVEIHCSPANRDPAEQRRAERAQQTRMHRPAVSADGRSQTQTRCPGGGTGPAAYCFADAHTSFQLCMAKDTPSRFAASSISSGVGPVHSKLSLESPDAAMR